MKKIVALSGGKDSTAMAIRLAEVEPDNYEYAITPTGRELPEMIQHWEKLEILLGAKLHRIPAPTMVELIVKSKTLPNWRMRWCTRQIKIQPFMDYCVKAAPAISYVGIRADEVTGDNAREGTNWKGVDGVTQDFPLVRWGWGLGDVIKFLDDKGVVIPKRTDCDFCFYQRLIEWWDLWNEHPDLWKEGEALEFYTGHTFRSPGRDTWPASMVELRGEFEKGRVPKETRGKPRSAMCSTCAR